MKFYKILALIVSACVLHQTVYSMTPGMIAKLRERKAAEKAAAAAAAAVGGEGGVYDVPRAAAMPPTMAPAAAAAAPVRRPAEVAAKAPQATASVARRPAAVAAPARRSTPVGDFPAPIEFPTATAVPVPAPQAEGDIDGLMRRLAPPSAVVARPLAPAAAAPAASGGAGRGAALSDLSAPAASGVSVDALSAAIAAALSDVNVAAAPTPAARAAAAPAVVAAPAASGGAGGAGGAGSFPVDSSSMAGLMATLPSLGNAFIENVQSTRRGMITEFGEELSAYFKNDGNFSDDFVYLIFAPVDLVRVGSSSTFGSFKEVAAAYIKRIISAGRHPLAFATFLFREVDAILSRLEAAAGTYGLVISDDYREKLAYYQEQSADAMVGLIVEIARRDTSGLTIEQIAERETAGMSAGRVAAIRAKVVAKAEANARVIKRALESLPRV